MGETGKQNSRAISSHLRTGLIGGLAGVLLAAAPSVAAAQTQCPTTQLPGATISESTATFPAKLKVLRAGVRDGRLDVLAEMTGRADGDEVKIDFIANGRRFSFAERVEDRRVRFERQLPAAQRRSRSGILEISYPGNERVRAASVRLRAAKGKAHLKRELLSLHDGVVTARGSLTSRAKGVVRLMLGYERPDGTVGQWHGRARVDRDGDWSLREQLPVDARHGGYLSLQFTGYLPSRIRGEQIAKQVLAGQSFGEASSSQYDGEASCGGSNAPDPTSVLGGEVLWSGDFETGNLSQWQHVLRASADRLTTVTSPVRQGRYAARLTADDSDLIVSGNPRAQLNTAPMHHEGDENYIGWSTYFPSNFPSVPSGAWFVFFQFHGEPYSGSPRLGFGVSPDGHIELRRDDVYNYDRVWSQPQARGRWTDLAVHVKWSKDPSVGFIELWVDGSRQTFSNGQTRLAMATIQSDQSAVETIATNYRKQGAIPGKVTLLHDAVKVGSSYASVQP